MGFPDFIGGLGEVDSTGFIPVVQDGGRKCTISLSVPSSSSLSPVSISLIERCLWIINAGELPANECFIESSASTVLLSLGRKGLIGNEVKACKSSGIDLFDDRRSFERYESAIFIQKVISTWIQNKKFDHVLALSDSIQQHLTAFAHKYDDIRKNNEFNARYNQRCEENSTEAELTKYECSVVSVFQRRFGHPCLKRVTAEWVWAVTLWEIVQVYERYSKDYAKATEIIELILCSGLMSNQRRKLFNRLTINYHSNLHQPQLALEAAINGLREGTSLPIYCLTEIARRTIRILRCCIPKEHFVDIKQDINVGITGNKKGKRKKKRTKLQSSKRKKKEILDEESLIELTESNSDTNTLKSLVDEESNGDNNDDRYREQVTNRDCEQQQLCEMLPLDIRELVRNLLRIRLNTETNIPRRVIYGRQLEGLSIPESSIKDKTSFKPRALYVNDRDDVQTVEVLALDWYFSSELSHQSHCSTLEPQLECQQRMGGWIGTHDEGGLLRDIFAILMINIFLDPEIPDAFIVPTQTAPLDLPTDVFYSSRRGKIEQRLEYLGALSQPELFIESLILCSRFYPCGVLGVAWRWLDACCASPRGDRWWKNFRQSFNMNSIVAVCSQQRNPRLFPNSPAVSAVQQTPSYTFAHLYSSSQKHMSRGEQRIDQPPEIVDSSPRNLSTRTPPSKSAIQNQHRTADLQQVVAHEYTPVSRQTLKVPSASSPQISPPSGSYRNAPLRVNPIDQIVFISSIIAGLGSRAIVSILKTFCLSFGIYKSGLPDLILWRSAIFYPSKPSHCPVPCRQHEPQTSHTISTVSKSMHLHFSSRGNIETLAATISMNPREFPALEIKLVEVKSENDRLSEKQRHWLAILMEAGVDVELFCICGKAPKKKSSDKP